MIMVFFTISWMPLAFSQEIESKFDPCSETAHNARRIVRIYDSALRDVARLGADSISIANLNSAFAALTAENASILIACSEIPNSSPIVILSSPTDGEFFNYGTSIDFTGSASDTEDGSLTDSLTWTSSLDGLIGIGGSFSSVLTEGQHIITATVNDSSGSSSNATVTINVGAQSKPSIALLDITPRIAFAGTKLPIMITASNPPPTGSVGFDAEASVVLQESTNLNSITITSTTIDTGTILSTLPGLAAGTYNVIVSNPDGSQGILFDAVLIVDDLSIAVDYIEPNTFSTTNVTTVIIHAKYPISLGMVPFMEGATVQFFEVGLQTALFPSNIIFIDYKTLQATIDSAAYPGTYDMIVINPDGTAGLLTNALTVTP